MEPNTTVTKSQEESPYAAALKFCPGTYHIGADAIVVCNDIGSSPSTTICVLKTRLEEAESFIQARMVESDSIRDDLKVAIGMIKSLTDVIKNA